MNFSITSQFALEGLEWGESFFGFFWHERTDFPHHFPLSFSLEEPLHCGLRGARLTLQESAAALHTKLHRLFQTFLSCKHVQKEKSEHENERLLPNVLEIAPLALKPLHCLRGSPCLTSCLLLLLMQNQKGIFFMTLSGCNTALKKCENVSPPWPFGGRGEGRAALSVPSAVGVASQTAVRASPAVDVAAVQRHLRQPSVRRHIQLLLRRHKQTTQPSCETAAKPAVRHLLQQQTYSFRGDLHCFDWGSAL